MRRILPITNGVRRLTEYHFAEHNGTRGTVRITRRIVKQVANKTGIPMPMFSHVLRHTNSISCVDKGISTRALMAHRGHDQLVTTETYLNVSPDDAIRKFRNR